MKKPSVSRSPEAGFTLIEALIAMVIMIFGLIAVSNLFVVATTSNQIALYTTVATAEANETLERLMAVPFTQLQSGGQTHDPANPWNPANWTSDLPSANSTRDVISGGNFQFNARRTVPGVGQVVTRWKIIDPAAGGTPTRYILVRSEVQAFFGRGATAQFTTFRACVAQSCPF